MVSPSGRGIRDARKIVALISARTHSQNARSPRRTARALIREVRRRNISSRADGAKIAREILEAHDAVDIGKRIFFTRTQPEIVCDRYSFGNNSPEFLPIPSFRTLRRREIIRHHPVPRVSHTSEFVEAAKLLISEGFAILSQR